MSGDESYTPESEEEDDKDLYGDGDEAGKQEMRSRRIDENQGDPPDGDDFGSGEREATWKEEFDQEQQDHPNERLAVLVAQRFPKVMTLYTGMIL